MASNRVKVEIIAELAKFLKPMKDAIKPIKELKKEIANTQAELKATQATKRLADKQKNLTQRVKTATLSYDKLKNKYKATSQASAELKNKLSATILKLRETRNKARENSKALSDATNNMRQYGASASATARRVDELKNKLRQQNQELERTNRISLSGIKSAAKGGMLAGGVGVGVGLGAAYTGVNFFNEAAQFKQTLALIEGQSLGVNFNRGEFSDYIRTIAKSSFFTPRQVADLAYRLQKAGFNPGEQMQQGILNALTDAATGTRTSTETVIQAFSTYYQPFKEMMAEQGVSVTDSVNMMVKATQSAPIDMQDFAESMKFLATTSSDMNITFEDTAALITMLGQRGLKGGIATRSFTSAMMRLADLTPKAQKIIKEYNDEVFGIGADIKFFDENTGKFTGMNHLIKMMEKIRKEVSQEDSLKFISQVFGKEAAKVFSALGKEGVEAFDKIKAAMKDAADQNLIAILKTKMLDTELGAAVQTVSRLQELSVTFLTETDLGRNFITMNENIQKGIDNIQKFTRENKELVGMLSTVAMYSTAIIIPVSALVFLLSGLTYVITSAIGGIGSLFGSIAKLTKWLQTTLRFISAFVVKLLPTALRRLAVGVLSIGSKFLPMIGWLAFAYEIISKITKLITGKGIGEWIGTGIKAIKMNTIGESTGEYNERITNNATRLTQAITSANTARAIGTATSFSNQGTSQSSVAPTNNVTINISGAEDPTVIAQKVKQELDNLQEYEGNFY